MSVEKLDLSEHTLNPEQFADAQQPLSELRAEAKVIAFRDERGIERQPNPVAAECYASPDIQQEVSSHFRRVDEELEGIEAATAVIAKCEEEGDRPKPFNPLSDELLEQVLTTATAQLPSLTHPVTKTVENVTVTGRHFKRSSTTTEEITVLEPVTGYTVSPSEQDTHRRWREGIGGVLRNEYGTKLEEMPAAEKHVQELLLDILTGVEPTWGERRNHHNETKLPLLAIRLRDSGVLAEQIKDLSWDDVTRLLPECSTLFTDISAGVAHQSARAVLQSLTRLESQLRAISPVGCDTIARIYYEDEVLEKMSSLNARISQLKQAPREVLFPGSEFPEQNDFLKEQRESMASFFEWSQPADAFYTHGTPYAPRAIRTGALRPAHRMLPTEFTFNSTRGTGSERSIDGSRGVHWAAPGHINYGRNDSHELVLSRLRQQLSERGGEALVQEDLAKGGIGMGRFSIRLGDLVSLTPYGGHNHTSHDRLRNTEQTPKARYGVVELTLKGWAKIAQQVSSNLGSNDAVYIAAPEHRDLDELFDYEYPVETLLIGIPSRDPDTIAQALREHGWSEEQIANQTYIFTDQDIDDTAELRARVSQQPKFPRSVVVPISKDL